MFTEKNKLIKQDLKLPKILAEKSRQLSFVPEKFKSTSAGILSLLPYIKQYDISDAITQSDYPETGMINYGNTDVMHKRERRSFGISLF